MKKHEIEVWIAIDSDGTYEVGEAEDIALERFSENVGGVCRLVKLNVRIGGPVVTETEVTVPDDAGSTVEADAA